MSRKKKRKTTNTGILFAAGILLVMLAYFYVKKPADYSDMCLRMEQNIGAALHELGIPEKNITVWRVEKRIKRKKWIKINLKAALSEKDTDRLIERLGKYRDFYADTTKTGSGTIIKLFLAGQSFTAGIIDIVPEKTGKLAIIIDDCGASKHKVTRFTEIGIPLSFAILPYQRHTGILAESLASSGFDTLLHLPMEAVKNDPKALGKGAVLADMNAKEIRKVVIKNLRLVPGVKGVNNHMGSLCTARKEIMSEVFSVLKKKGLFFVDSATSRESVCLKLAGETGLPCMRNNIFLDNIDSRGEIKKRIKQAITTARKRGSAIAIGHATRKNTASAIREMLPSLASVEIVPVSRLMPVNRAGDK